MVAFASVARMVGQDPKLESQARTLVSWIVGLAENAPLALNADDVNGTLLKFLSVLFVTIPWCAKESSVARAAFRCVESCLTSNGKEVNC